MKASELRRLARGLVPGSYDIVHIQTPFVAHYLGVKMARQMGIACVETYHTFFEEYLYHYVPLLPKPLLKFLARSLTVSWGRPPSRVLTWLAAERQVHGYTEVHGGVCRDQTRI